MKNRLLVTFISFIINLLFSYSAWAATVQVDIIHSRDLYPLGDTYPTILRLKVSKPWYIHGTKGKGSELIPTVLSFESPPGLRVEEIRFPEPEKKKFEYTSDAVEVFSGVILVKGALVVDADAQEGKQLIKGNLSYQACSTNICLPPEKIPISFTLTTVLRDTPSMALNQDTFLSTGEEKDSQEVFPVGRPGTGFWFILLGLFFGGLALNLTPCVYPLIPITVSYFGGRSEALRGHKLVHGVLYISGLALTNSVLGLSAALTGGMLGSALQNPYVLIFVAGIMVCLSLSFFGLWEISVPTGLTRFASKNYSGLFGTFFMGLTLGIVAAPCLGPFVLGLLTYVGQRGDPFLGFLYFFVLSLGLGLPLSVLAIFSGAIEKLPISGDWMVWVKKFMGWVLIGMAAYMIGPLIPGAMGKSGLLSGIAIVAAIHLGWIDSTGKTLRGFLHFKRFSSILIAGIGIIYLVAAIHKGEGIKWIPYNETIIKEAARDKKPLILDFFADWCGPCVAMDKKVFRSPRVVAVSRNFINMRLDLTRRQPFQERVLKRYRIRGVPTVIFLNGEGLEEKRLRVESLIDRSDFIKRMKWLLEKSDLKL